MKSYYKLIFAISILVICVLAILVFVIKIPIPGFPVKVAIKDKVGQTKSVNEENQIADVPIAAIMKVIKDVGFKKGSANWENGKLNQLLATNDGVRTGEKSLALIKFTDHSLIRMRENSSLKIYANKINDHLSKNVYIEKGNVGFNISKQEDDEFRFTLPTMIASIRGTEGYFLITGEKTLLYCSKGIIIVTPTYGAKENKTIVGGTFAEITNNGTVSQGQATVQMKTENSIINETSFLDTNKGAMLVEIAAENNITSAPAGMVMVAGGTFVMGDAYSSSSLPLHQVTIKSYYISKTEVTQGQWKAVMGSNPSYFPTVGINGPVELVSWFDCISYCNKRSIQEGKTPVYSINGNTNPSSWTSGVIARDTTAKGYRLPTEAEWEYAALGGHQSHGYAFSGSNNEDGAAWTNDNSGGITHIVGTKAANELGLFDMSGNVREWCWDWYAPYSDTEQTNPTGPTSGTQRILRGGSWYNNSNGVCRVSVRLNVNPGDYYYDLGFRVAEDY